MEICHCLVGDSSYSVLLLPLRVVRMLLFNCCSAFVSRAFINFCGTFVLLLFCLRFAFVLLLCCSCFFFVVVVCVAFVCLFTCVVVAFFSFACLLLFLYCLCFTVVLFRFCFAFVLPFCCFCFALVSLVHVAQRASHRVSPGA